MALTLRGSKNFPLTNIELDNNFTYLDERINLKLDTASFNATSVNNLIIAGPQGAASGINSSLLRGYAPTNLNQNNTIVQRDGSGAFIATSITASTFNGKATDASHADEADTAATLSVTLPINKGGTGATSAASARTNLAAVGITGDTMSGKLTFVTTSTSTASLNIPYGSAPTSPVSGDFWATSSNLFYRVGTLSKTIAYTDSNITGTSGNISGIAAVANGGTGSNTAAGARTNLGVAKAGANSDITSISGLTTALTTAQGGTHVSNPGPAGYVLTSNGTRWIAKDPELFQTFNTGVASPTPNTFDSKKVQGFDAYNSTDFPGQYYVGLTVTGTGSRSAQLGMGWNTEETKSGNLAFRVNDDTSDVTAWSPWSSIWNEVNLPVSVASTANSVPKRNADGHLFASYYNQSSNNSENPTISQIMVTNGSDNYVRKASIAHLAASLSGTASITITGNAGNVTGIVAVANGGTGSNTAAGARTNLGVAKSGSNSDITSISGLTTAISAAQGGTGLTNPGTSGNVLVSNGTGWQSQSIGYPVPAGAVMAFYRQTAPEGWLECDGQIVSATTYPNLAAALNASGNFALPDLRGEFIRGADRGRGLDPNRDIGSTQKGSIQAYDESNDFIWSLSTVQDGVNSPIGLGLDIMPNPSDYPHARLQGVAGIPGTSTTTPNYGSGGWFGVSRPRNVALLYCIKY